jgi:hypothetical protein
MSSLHSYWAHLASPEGAEIQYRLFVELERLSIVQVITVRRRHLLTNFIAIRPISAAGLLPYFPIIAHFFLSAPKVFCGDRPKNFPRPIIPFVSVFFLIVSELGPSILGRIFSCIFSRVWSFFKLNWPLHCLICIILRAHNKFELD